jgi:hypothetical protein
LRNERALRALRTLDEGDIAEAYLRVISTLKATC